MYRKKQREQIRENPYLQYFLGLEAYTDDAPFDPSMMVHFRKRLNESIPAEINELIVDRRSDRDQNDQQDTPEDDCGGNGEAGGSGEEPGNVEILLMDASSSSGRHPVSDRQQARKDYLAVAKKRRAGRKAIRIAIGKQLRYIRRNLRFVNELAGGDRLSLLSRREYRNLLVCSEVYRGAEAHV